MPAYERSDEDITPTALKIAGDAYEMGFIHGKAAARSNALGTLAYYGNFIDHVFSFQASSNLEKGIRLAAKNFFRATVERKIIEQIPAYYRDSIRGLADGSGLPVDLVLKGFVMPDFYSYLVSLRPYAFPGKRILDTIQLGCTSMAVRTETADQKGARILHARNLDFPSADHWLRNPVILEFHPTDGQRYASVSSLGVHTAGVTSMNESGISLSLNMNYSKNVRSDGIPIIIIGNEVIRRAKRIRDAVSIIQSMPRCTGWTFLISSQRENSAAIVEVDAKTTSVHWLDNRKFLLCTNHYQDEALRNHEYWVTRGRSMDTLGRYRSALAQLNDLQNPQLGDLIQILGNDFDPFLKARRNFGCTVCQVHTVSSVVMDSSSFQVHFACGMPPLSHRPFRSFAHFPGPRELDTQPLQPRETTKKDRSRYEYGRAYFSYFPEENLHSSAEYLENAIAFDSEDPIYFFMLAIVELKRGELGRSLTAITRALGIPESQERKNLYRLYHARILDLLDQRDAAKKEYEQLLEDPYFQTKARKGLKRRFKRKDVDRLVLDFTIGDVIEA